ncbi:MAG: lipoyl(octanoyl) transferase LipB [Gammaproteobacteria bacterium]|nr:lipoyl(octanoyl) transferase LipB [Gammaproteobacteria bacterium]
MSSPQDIIEAENCRLRFMGLQPYEKVWQQMLEFTLSRTPLSIDEIWVLQHEPVFTLGQAGKDEHILNAQDIPVVRTDRGGQVTYHGPGQLVIYLLIDVRRSKLGIRYLVDLIENSIISVLATFGIKGATLARAPGVYVDEKKIAALGLRIKQGCSYHGLSFNIDMDLKPFSFINPCGYVGLETTQLIDLLDQPKDELFQLTQDKLLKVLQTNLI